MGWEWGRLVHFGLRRDEVDLGCFEHLGRDFSELALGEVLSLIPTARGGRTLSVVWLGALGNYCLGLEMGQGADLNGW